MAIELIKMNFAKAAFIRLNQRYQLAKYSSIYCLPVSSIIITCFSPYKLFSIRRVLTYFQQFIQQSV